MARLELDGARGFTAVSTLEFVTGAVPEPSTLALLAVGAGALALRRFRKA
ncbi:MAG: PEP-CTERM sorting domain-containing protein [Acidobacteria bacterium]|nr:PEP-CTERM sorting domain-containing protein [Acidobacteriota bacterium]